MGIPFIVGYKKVLGFAKGSWKLKDFWFNLPDKLRFLLVGGFNACVSYVIYSSFCLLLGQEAYQTALAIAWIVTSFVSFTTQKFLVFQGKGNWIKEYFKCCTTWVFSYMINAVVLEVLVKFIHINVFVAQIIATLTAAVFTYILFKKFAFKAK